jgi:hypothetical protein
LRALVDRANRGDAAALVELRGMLDTYPQIWQTCGDLGRSAERAWVELLAGTEVLGSESIERYLQRMKTDLLGSQPTRLEQILVDDIAVCYLAARHADILAAEPGTHSLGQGALRIRRCDSAHRRLHRAVKNLALLRAKAQAGLAPLVTLPASGKGEQVTKPA